jgi:hypothetical protein
MPHYQHFDVSFNVPDDWNDRTVTAFAAPLLPGQKVAPNIVLTRDILADNEAVSAYADRQLVELAKRMDRFTLRHRREVRLGGLPSVELSFTWHSGNGTLQQKVMFVVVRQHIVLTFAATMLESDSAKAESLFDEIFASIKFPESAS